MPDNSSPNWHEHQPLDTRAFDRLQEATDRLQQALEKPLPPPQE